MFQSRKKQYTDDGGHRALSPEAAFERYRHHIDSLVGVVRYLRRLEPPPGAPFHTYVARHSLVEVIDTLEKLHLNEEVGSSGKGMTEAQARASALFESLERYSAVWQDTEYQIMGTYNDLKDVAIHPKELLGFSVRQYKARLVWNAACPSPALLVPEPFDENVSVAWVPAWSLHQERMRYIPAAYAYFGYPDTEAPFCYADSNGNAAGSTLEEAVLQGLFELVERDAVAIWFYNRLRRPGIDLSSFDDPYFDELLDYYRRALHREVWTLDVTSDLNIPSVVAVSRCTDRWPEEIIMGFGCHLDPRLAVSRALTEMNQILHGLMQHRSEGEPRVRDPLMETWLHSVTLEKHRYLAPDLNLPAKRKGDYARSCSDDLLDDLHLCLSQMVACGLDPYVLNLTREDIGLPVVKVVVSGLVHYWRRLGYRRLYEVPVKLGWLTTARTEEAMNPFSIVI